MLTVFLCRSLSYIVDMVGQRLADIPRSTRVSYWHHMVPNFYGYLYYERL